MSTIAFPSVNPAVIVSLIVPPKPLSRSQEQKGLLNETFSQAQSIFNNYILFKTFPNFVENLLLF